MRGIFGGWRVKFAFGICEFLTLNDEFEHFIDYVYLYRRRRYSLETIRNLVTHEAHEYYAKHGFPAGYFTSSSSSSSNPSSAGYPSGSGYGITMMRSPSPSRMKRQVSGSSDGSDGGGSGGSNPTSPINFMDEPVYDWEIAMSDDEEIEGENVGEEIGVDEEDDEEDVDDDEDEEDDEDYEEYDEDEEQDAEHRQQQQQESGAVEGEGERADDKENVEEVRRRRRSSLLRHLRKPSGGGESDDASSPDPEGPSSAEDDKNKSKAEGQVGEEDDVEMDVDIDLDIEDLDEALEDPNFNLELSSCASASGSPTSPQQMSSPSSPSSATSPSSGQANGVFTAFYVPPVQQVFAPQPMPAQDSSSSALGGALGGESLSPAGPTTAPPSSPSPDGSSSLLIDPSSASPSPPSTPPPPAVQQVQLPLQTIQIPMHIPSPTPPPIMDLPPPRLSSVPVWALRNMEMLGGSMGKGTPVNRERAAEWAGAWSIVTASSTMARSISADGSVSPAENVVGDNSKREADFRMEVDSAEGGGRREGEIKPVLRLSLPGDDLDVSLSVTSSSSNPAESGEIQPQGAAGSTDSNAASSSSKQSMLVDFEPQNQAAWDAFLASLGDPLTTAPSSSSSGVQQSAQQGMLGHDLRGAPPPYSSLHPPHSPPPPTPTPPSPASSTCSLSQESSGSPGSPGPSVTIHSPGTSANNGGMMNPMFGMMNVNMMFGVPGAQGSGGNGGYAHQGGGQMQQLIAQQQQGGSEVGVAGGASGQQCFPAMGLTMSMPPPSPAAAMGMTASMGGPSFNNAPPFNSMPSFNMGMGLGMNPATMNMNVPLNMGMGMPMPMSMQMPMSMPFAGLQLGLTLSLAPQQHSAHQQQQQQNQGQLQWLPGGSGVQGNGGVGAQVPGVDFDLAALGAPGNGIGIGPGGDGMNMFSLVNASTPANTPLNSPLSPPSSSIPSSMLGVLSSGSPSSVPKENEKGPGGMGSGGAGATPSTLSYALG